MPSASYKLFLDNVVDVERLIESHGALHDGNPGKKGLGHITRSGIVMLCAAWEVYVEELLVQSVEHLTTCCDPPSQLPKPVKKYLSGRVRDDKHELKPIHFGGTGWIDVYKCYVRQSVDALNTPKSENTDPLYRRYVGLIDMSSCWSVGSSGIDDFVTSRGEIAHKGRSATYVRIKQLRDDLALVKAAVAETDNALANHLRSVSPNNKLPWYRIKV